MSPQVTQKLLTFFRNYPFRRYPKNKILVFPERVPTGVFLLTEGVVKSFSTSEKGDELILNIFKPVSFFPMFWVMQGKPDKYAYAALTKVEVYIAPKRRFKHFLQTEPEVMFDLLSRIYRGLEGFYRRMETQLGNEAYAKVLLQLRIYAQRFSQKELEVLLPTHKQIAAETGLSRETVSRWMRKLQQKGLIVYEHHRLVLINQAKLEKELGTVF